ncbi:MULTISPECIES: ligase-associated DNA damage response exonuclease [Sphingomonas]|uniref:ligase-associated DNA damage response exonuclease n=1 Tax=Sphingomonas TaxID=13687 RepID=UPI0025506A10|nr:MULTISPECIES: ligase-associated DNA damage response exonuclease [Sphingomonas]MDK8186987.1 ligase-associated DNA damage response exonuclease [Sphingomonas zeae]MDK8216805.1 ligase-associated DNA damage response exonuclease [Sphingomonas sp. UMB7805-LC452B]
MTRTSDLLTLTPAGLYCPPGDFHIDAMRGVSRNLVTHAHSDHARGGHVAVMATAETLAIMEIRLGDAFCARREAIGYGEVHRIGDVRVSFHPAGHILGSAQIAIEKDGHRVVVSGDYKRRPDPTCAPFEVVPCDAFVTEATFGLPIFAFPDPEAEVQRLLASRAMFPDRTHTVGAYALGKAQRLMRMLAVAGYDRPVWYHPAVAPLADYYRAQGIDLGNIRPAEEAPPASLAGEIVICTPGALKNGWAERFPDPLIATASGWMQVRARARQISVLLPLVISDHADWPALCRTAADTGAQELWVTHGETEALVYWASAAGLDARPLDLIGYGDEDGEVAA